MFATFYHLQKLFSKHYYFLLEVLDTAAGVWLDRNGIVTSTRVNKSAADLDPSLELLRRCRHGSASVGTQIFIFGGLKGGEYKSYVALPSKPVLSAVGHSAVQAWQLLTDELIKQLFPPNFFNVDSNVTLKFLSFMMNVSHETNS